MTDGATGDDFDVGDAEVAREILHHLGVGDEASLEPAADARRSRVAAIVQRHVGRCLAERAFRESVPPACLAFIEGFARSLDDNFAFWSSPSAEKVRTPLYRLWAQANAEVVCRPTACPAEVASALTPPSAQPSAGAVSVKPLEWGENHHVKKFGMVWSIHRTYGMWYWHGPDGANDQPYEFSWQAKAAAQADYEQRILSALVSTPAPTAPSREAVIEKAWRAVVRSFSPPAGHDGCGTVVVPAIERRHIEIAADAILYMIGGK